MDDGDIEAVRSGKLPLSLELQGGSMAKITCPKCGVELYEVLSVDEYIMEYDDDDEAYLPQQPTATIIKCARCGTQLQKY